MTWLIGYELALVLAMVLLTALMVAAAWLAAETFRLIGVGPVGRNVAHGLHCSALGWIGLSFSQILLLTAHAPRTLSDPLIHLSLASALIGIAIKGVGAWLLVRGFRQWRTAARVLYRAAGLSEVNLQL